MFGMKARRSARQFHQEDMRRERAAIEALLKDSARRVTESADVMKQWGNPCVEEAVREYERRRFFPT